MDIKDVENLARLARIELSEDEKRGLLSDMGSILEYVKVIEKIEMSKEDQEYIQKNVWREDEIAPRDFSLDIITEQFPNSQDNFLKVKKIL